MDPSLRIVPANAPKSASVTDTANSLGLHDTLQYGPRSIAAEIKTEGGLKERLENVRALLHIPFPTHEQLVGGNTRQP
jgi:hypothetical protein